MTDRATDIMDEMESIIALRGETSSIDIVALLTAFCLMLPRVPTDVNMKANIILDQVLANYPPRLRDLLHEFMML